MLRSITAIPLSVGSIPDPADVVGREFLAGKLANDLRRKSVLLTGDRRIGKTSLAQLVAFNLRAEGRHVLRVSAERQSLSDFAYELAEEFRHQYRELSLDELDAWTGGLTELETGQPDLRLLEELFGLIARAGREAPIVIVIDELPILTAALETEKAGAGSELLHLLRGVRQRARGSLSLLLISSLGLHHLPGDAVGALNDVVLQRVDPLAHDDAVTLACSLLVGARVKVSDLLEVGDAIARAVEGVPFYVHHLVRDCRDQFRGSTVEPEDIDSLIDAALSDPDDPFRLRHYRTRLPQLYGTRALKLMTALLDTYAEADMALTVDECRDRLAQRPGIDLPERTDLVTSIERLKDDHYLIRESGVDRFATALLRRAWLAYSR